MLALSIAAIPMTIKLRGIKLALKKVLSVIATRNPRKAPINRLGANTPPSPPEAKVTEVTMGFIIRIPMIVMAKGRVNGICVEW